jgi:hypothetical protein
MELSKGTTLPTLSARKIWLIAILIAVLHAAMAVTAVNTKSPTFDEPQHLTAGYSYWVTNDFRLDSENGNLPQRWAALPLLFSPPGFISVENEPWRWASEGLTAHQFFYERGNNPASLLQQGRMMMSILSAALCLLIYRCAREFFGPIGGLLSEIAAAFDPTMLAHGALVTSDIAVTFFFLATLWTTWRMLEKLTPGRFFLAALSISGLFVAKFSAPIVIPVMSILCVIKIVTRAPISIQIGRFQRTICARWKKAGAVIASFALLGVVTWIAIWGSFSFRFNALNDGDFTRGILNERWNLTLAQHDPMENAIAFMRARHLFPEAYLYGLAFVHAHAADRPAFLDNQWSIVGFRSFFPRAFLYKTPLPFLGLLGMAIIAALARWNKARRFSISVWTIVRRDLLQSAPFWVFGVVYGGGAMMSHLNIGQRHLLPIYPALFIACGACAYLFRGERQFLGRSVVAFLLLWQSAESFIVRPDYLAYFNQLAGGPRSGYRHLVDSSLDWGQDLPALKTWLNGNAGCIAGKPVYLAYFGSADPEWYGIHATSLPRDPSSKRAAAGLTAGIYCVSATVLQQVYADQMGRWSQPYEDRYRKALSEIARYRNGARDPVARTNLVHLETTEDWPEKIKAFENLRFARLCAYLRQREPLAQIGCSIFVFALSTDEIDQALYGPPAEFARAISVIGL